MTYAFYNPNSSICRGTLELDSCDIQDWYNKYAACNRDATNEQEMVEALAESFGATVKQY